MEANTQYKVTLSPNVQKNLISTRDAIEAAANAENVSFIEAFKMCVEMLRATWTLCEDTLPAVSESGIFVDKDIQRVFDTVPEVKNSQLIFQLALIDLRRQTNRAPKE